MFGEKEEEMVMKIAINLATKFCLIFFNNLLKKLQKKLQKNVMTKIMYVNFMDILLLVIDFK